MPFSFNKPPNWSNMPLFSKIAYYKTKLDERFAPYVDKIEAKMIVKKALEEDICIPKIVRILNGPNDFNKGDINPNHMVKATHGCGWNINMTEQTTVQEVIKSLQKWNIKYNWWEEKQYEHINPRFFIEEKIDGPTGGHVLVYMFRCIRGQPITIGVKCIKQDKQNSYDLDWNPIVPMKLEGIEKPAHLTTMLGLAAKLAKPFEFVRIDLYYVDEKIYFSEYTFTPAGGMKIFPLELEMKYGKLWR
jgi:hypothetical protein